MQMQQQPEESSICCNKSTHIYMWPSPNRKVFPSPQSSEASDGSKPIVEGQINPPRPSAPPLVAATADGEGNQTVPTSIHEDDHEAVIDLTEHQAPSVDDEEDADYVPESLRSFVQQANNRLWQETQGFYSTLLPHSTDSQDAAEETDASVPNPTFSPDASNIYNSPAATVAKSHAYETPTIDLTNVPETISTPPAAAATIISDDDGTKPEPTALFASPPSNVQDDQKQETASQPVLSISHIGELDETQESMQLESFGDTEGQNMLAPEQFDLDSLESDLVQGEKQGDEIDESLPSDEDPPVPSPLTNIVLPSSIAPVDAPLPPPDTLKDEDAALVPVKDHPMPAETGVERHAQASPKIAGQAKVLLPAIVKQAGESWPAAMGPEVSQMESPAATKDVVTEDEVHESSLGAQQKSSTGSAAAPAADTEKAPSMSFWQRVTQPVLPSQAEKDVSVAEVQTSAQASFALPDQVPVGNPFNPPTTLDEEHALFPAKSQPAIAFEPQKHVAGVREQSISPSVTALEDAQLPETKPNSTQNQSESQQIVRNPPAAKINVSGKEAAASFLFAPDDKFDLSNEKMSTPTSSLQHPLAPPTVASRAKEHERPPSVTEVTASSSTSPQSSVAKLSSTTTKPNTPLNSLQHRLSQPTTASKAKEHDHRAKIAVSTEPPTKFLSTDSIVAKKATNPGTTAILDRLTQPTSASKAKELGHNKNNIHETVLATQVASHETEITKVTHSDAIKKVEDAEAKALATSPPDRLLQPTAASKAKQHAPIEHVQDSSLSVTESTVVSTTEPPKSPELLTRKSVSPSLHLLDRLSKPTSASKAKEREHTSQVSPTTSDEKLRLRKAALAPIDTSLSPASPASSPTIVDQVTRLTAASSDHAVRATLEQSAPENESKGEVPRTPCKSSAPVSIEAFLGSTHEQPSPIQTVASPVSHDTERCSKQEVSMATRPDMPRPASDSVVKPDLIAAGPLSTVGARRIALKGNASITPAADQAVAAALARIRQVRQKDKALLGKENGKPRSKPPMGRMYSARTPNVRQLTVPKSPHFATTAKLGDSKLRARDRLAEMTFAQSTDLLRRGLRDSSVSFTSDGVASTRPRTLTVPQSPKFTMTAKYGEKRLSASRNGQNKAAPSLAQSGEVLASQLRVFDPPLTTTSARQVTLPVSPKFHSTSKRHERPMAVNNEGIQPVRQSRVSMPNASIRLSTRPALLPFGNSVTDTVINSVFKARPMPNFGKHASVVRMASKTSFRSLTARDKQMCTRSDDGTDDDMEQKRPFKAKPLPSTTYQPERIKKPAKALTKESAETATKPFNLKSANRHEQYQAKLREKLREQEEQEKAQRQFHAKEFKCPPAPESRIKSSKAPTTPAPFQLASLDRHEKFELETKQKLADEDEEMRRLANFKATPVPKSTYESTNSPPHGPKVEEERRRKEMLQDDERRRAANFKAKPLPKTTYKYIPISSPKPPEKSNKAPQTL
ncbi:hypothetical protein MPSEU_000085800 [Mayamaea pseudoterrestris]|nr:hypothetical protein MPSEU_000085800 [Mayamaea pseudoterrestris]